MGKKRSGGDRFRPGERVPQSGQYEMEGPRGGKGPERTLVQGEPFPPGLKPGMRYHLVDPTRTK